MPAGRSLSSLCCECALTGRQLESHKSKVGRGERVLPLTKGKGVSKSFRCPRIRKLNLEDREGRSSLSFT